MLHGGGSDPDFVFDGGPDKAKFGGLVAANAEKHNFIIVAPTGYKQAAWGSEFRPIPNRPANAAPRAGGTPPAGGAGAPPAGRAGGARAGGRAPVSPEEQARNNALAEKDVLNVVDRVSKEYNVDTKRIYLMGNSLGEVGVLHLAVEFAGRWCAIGPSDGSIDPATYPYEKAKGLSGVMIVHGEQDTLAPLDANKKIAENFKSAGFDAKFVSVPDGGHSTAWYLAMGQVFEFFDQHPCK
jgi:pimeloyl-ACP methyl ester carboxylesterase